MADKTPVARVSAIQGKAFVKAADGTMHPLRVGDVIYEGDVVVTSGASRVDLATPDGLSHVMRGNETLTVDAETVAAIKPDATDAALVSGAKDVNRVIQAINQGGDLDALLEEPAAGESGGSANGGPSFVRLLRIAESVDPLAFNFGTTPADTTDTGTIGAAAADTATPTTPTTSTTVPGAPTVSILDGGDGVLNAAEIAAGAKASIGLPSNATAGDSLKVDTNGDGIPDVTHTLTADDIAAGKVTVAIPPGDIPANGIVTVSATITNTSGSNSPTSSASSTTDTAAAATITVDNITPDNVLNAAESGQTIAVTGTVGGDAKPGDTVTLTINGKEFTGTVLPGGTYSINVPGADLLADADHTVAAKVTGTDEHGNPFTGNGSQTYTTDTAAAATITVDNITPDNVLNAAESGQTIAVTGTVGGDAKPGDTVTLTINGKEFTGTVLPGGTYSINVPGADLLADADHTVAAKVTGTDEHGNPFTGNGSQTYTTDTAAAATITVDNITPDNVLNAAESGQTIAVTGTVGGDAKPGDTVTLTINGKEFTGTVLPGGTYSINVPGADLLADADHTVAAKVTGTDEHGNPFTGNGSQTYTTDTAAAATITVDNITPDNVLNAAESGQTIAVTGTVGGDAKPGDTVTLTINGKEFTGTVLPGGTYSINVPGADLLADADHTVAAKVTGTDEHGNPFTGNGSQTYTTDTAAAATITVDNITPDNVLNAAESGQTIAVTGTVGGDAKPGDTVTLTINGKEFTGTVLPGGTYSINVPGADLLADADHTVAAKVTGTDEHGNPFTGNGSQTYTTDTAAAATITVDNITPDNVLNAAESGQTIAVTGTVGGDAKPGDTVTLTINGKEFTGTVLPGGTYSINVPGADLLADADHTVAAKVTGTDEHGNPFTGNGSQTYTTDTAAAATITVDNITPDNVLNAAESGQTIAVTGTVGGDAKPGDTVTLTINGKEFTGTVLPGGTYSINVPGADLLADADHTVAAKVTGTDEHGNPFTGNGSQTYTTDTAAAATITVDNITPDNVLNAAESGQTIAVTGTVGGDAKPGDTVTLTINGKEFTGTVLPGGTYSINVPGADLLADADHTVAAKVTGTDEHGNPFTGNGSHIYSVNGEPTAVADTFTPTEDQPFTGNLASNDTPSTDGGNVWSKASDPAHGSVVVHPDGTFTYTAAANYSGPDSFTYTITDADGSTSTASVTLNVTPVADKPLLQPLSDIYVVTQGNTIISTGATDVVVNSYEMGSGVTQANLEAELGLPAGYLDNRFDPTGANVNDPGTVNVVDGKVTESNYTMTAGMKVTWDYSFKNGEDLASEVAGGYNDIVVLVVTDPLGNKQSFLVDSSEAKFPSLGSNGSYSFTATMAGNYTFDWLVLNSGDGYKDSSLSISKAQFTKDGDPSSHYGAPVALPILASLADTDGSEQLTVTIANVPDGASFSAGTHNPDGSWTFTAAQLVNLELLPPANYVGTMSLTVTATATESANHDVASSTSQTVNITISETTNTYTDSTEAAQTIVGTDGNDLIRGYAGNDNISGGGGDDLIYGGAGNDTINGGTGNDNLYGGVGNDSILGGTGNDKLDGGAGADVLDGGDGNDLLIGGLGNDTLSGGLGVDVFQWNLGDRGTAGSPAVDTITDFSTAARSAGGDVLDLRDLLQGEHSALTSADHVGNLNNYLHFTVSGDTTTVQISSSGGFAGGFNTASVDQQIVLSHVDLSAGGLTTDQLIIQDLLNKGKLITD